MTATEKLVFRAAGRIRDRLWKHPQERLAVRLPTDYWQNITRLTRQIEIAVHAVGATQRNHCGRTSPAPLIIAANVRWDCHELNKEPGRFLPYPPFIARS